MERKQIGVGAFTSDNIEAVLKALPKTIGTYADVAQQAAEFGVTLSPYTVARWVNNGRRDLKARNTESAYGQFAKRYDALKAKHCTPGQNRMREMNRALEILNGRCECGQPKARLRNGKLADSCETCIQLDGGVNG